MVTNEGKVKVKVNLRLLSTKDDLELELKEGATVSSLLEKLVLVYGKDLKKLVGDPDEGYKVMVVVNKKLVKPSQNLKEGDELYLSLPIAGG